MLNVLYLKYRFKSLLFICTILIIFYFYEKYINCNSKLKYFVQNDEIFLKKFDENLSSSLNALSEIKTWLTETSSRPLFNKKPNKAYKNNLCVFLISKHRYGKRFYPIQTLVSLLTRAQLKNDDKLSITILSLNENLNKTDLKLVESIVEIVSIRHDLHASNHNPKIRETLDYSFVMKYIYKNRSECNNILLLEDDSIAAPNWYDSIQKALNEMDSDWFCLKLFTSYKPFDWLKYSPTVFLSFVYILGLFLLIRFALKIINTRLNWLDLIFCWILSTCSVFFWNSFSTNPLGYGTIRFTQGFNTVANLYQTKYLQIIYRYLDETVIEFNRNPKISFTPKDIALANLKSLLGLDEYIVEPCLFQHIGLHSSLNSKNDIYIHDEYGRVDDAFKYQYAPFQSYTFIKEFGEIPIEFKKSYFLST